MKFLSIFNISLRAITLMSRFLLMFFIAKFLSPGSLGLYGIFSTTILFSLYVVGLDFYIYSTRELIISERKTWGRFLASQFKLSLILYLFYLPLMFLVFYYKFMPINIFPYFVIILILEHLCQEIQRVLIAAQKPIVANIGLFLRNGFWPLLLIALYLFKLVHVDIGLIFELWIFGDALAVLFYVYYLLKLNISGWRGKTDWSWVVNGIKISLFFLVGTLALRFNSVSERYWMQYINGLELVGVYSFFIGINSIISSFIDAGVVSFLYPKMIKAKSDNDSEKYKKIRKKLSVQIFIWTGVLTFASLMLINQVLLFIDKNEYYAHIGMYYITLTSAAIACIGLIPHYDLYARKKDRVIVYTHVISLIVFLISGICLSKIFNIYAIPLAVLIAQIYIVGSKYFYLRRDVNEYPNIN